MNKFAEVTKRLGRFLLNLFTRRLWLKIISLVLALILWTYIVSTNTSLTRTKTFEDISVAAGSKTELSSRTLALATDVQSEYTNAIEVTVEVPQSQYSLLNEDNITLTADLSGINAAGKWEAPLRGNTTYGSIKQLDPSTVLVTVENLESRNYSVGLEIVNADDENYWYDIDTAAGALNPRTITVSGPESVVSTISRAVVQVDVEGRTQNPRRAFSVVLEDAKDQAVNTALITLSTRACYVSLGIYPKKTLGITPDLVELSRRIPEGYEIVEVVCQPEAVIIAADSKSLETYDSLALVLDDIQDVSGTHVYSLLMPSNIRYSSADEVTVTVFTAPIGDGADSE